MKCTQCKTEWSAACRSVGGCAVGVSFACRCWLCACAIVPGGTYPSHYAAWNVFGCSGGQFTDIQPQSSIASKIGFALLSPLVLAVAIALFAIWCGMQIKQTQSLQLTIKRAMRLTLSSYCFARLPFLPLWIAVYACSERMRSMTFIGMFTKTLQIEVRLTAMFRQSLSNRRSARALVPLIFNFMCRGACC